MNDLADAPKSGLFQIGSVFWAIFVAGVIILFMAAIAGPKLIESRLPGNESAAIGTLKFFKSSQQLYKEQGHANYANMAELQGTALKGHFLEKNSEMQGYKYACQPAKSKPSEAWWATAEPSDPGKTGKRFFAINHSGNVYYCLDKPVTPNPETGEILTSDQIKLVGQP